MLYFGQSRLELGLRGSVVRADEKLTAFITEGPVVIAIPAIQKRTHRALARVNIELGFALCFESINDL